MSNYLASLQGKSLEGSVADAANKSGKSLARAIADVDVVVLGDNSGSMEVVDVPWQGGLLVSREEKLVRELAEIYKAHPGKVLLIEFSDRAEIRPSGLFSGQHAGTSITPALQMAHDLDDTGVQFIVLSDGLASDGDRAIKIAGSFKTNIDVVYIGPETGSDASEGRSFLRQLAYVSGGRFATQPEVNVRENVEMLFLADGAR